MDEAEMFVIVRLCVSVLVRGMYGDVNTAMTGDELIALLVEYRGMFDRLIASLEEVFRC